MEVEKKLKVGEVRKEIGNLKKGLFKNVAVMRSDDLRAYLDDLRYAENVINAKKATGQMGPTEDKTEKDDMIYSKKTKKETIDTDSESETKSVEEEKKVVKKVERKVKEVEKEMKKEKPMTMKAEHKKEVKKLDEIPKELKAMVKKHMKEHPDHSEKKALSVVKKSLLKVLS